MARPLATDMVEWTDENGNVHEVTRALRVKLLQPYRGQKMSDLEKEVLRFFKDVPVLDGAKAKTKLILKASGLVRTLRRRVQRDEAAQVYRGMPRNI